MLEPKELLSEASRLGVFDAVVQVVRAILAGEPTQAERLAKNAALAASAKIAARERIRRTRK